MTGQGEAIMRMLVKLAMATGLVAALYAGVVAPGASAARFTGSGPGSFEGAQTSSQVFTGSAGGPNVTCTKARTTGTVVAFEAETQEITVEYSACTAHLLLTTPASVSKATYVLNANGSVQIKEAITITVPALGCTTTVGPQTVSSISYDNGLGLEVTSNVTGIHSTSTGLCPSGTTGTFTGNNLIAGTGGLVWDA
jgi:hypothetical protein